MYAYTLCTVCTLVDVISSSLLMGKTEIGRHTKKIVFSYLVTNKAVFAYLREKNKLAKPFSYTHYESKVNKSVFHPPWGVFSPKINVCPKYMLQHFSFSQSVLNTTLFPQPKLVRIKESKLGKRSDYTEIEIFIRTTISAKEDNHKGNVSFDP